MDRKKSFIVSFFLGEVTSEIIVFLQNRRYVFWYYLAHREKEYVVPYCHFGHSFDTHGENL